MDYSSMLRVVFVSSLAAFTLTACGGSSSSSSTATDNGGEPNAGGMQQQPPVPSLSRACREHEIQITDLPKVPLLDIQTYPAYANEVANFAGANKGAFASFAISAVGFDALKNDVTLSSCSYELFDEYQCTLIGNVENPMINNDALAFTVSDADGASVQVNIADRAYSSGQILGTESDGSTFTAEWVREADGRERYKSSHSNGNIFDFTENPDCSATANLVSVGESDDNYTVKLAWDSPQDDMITVSYEYCDSDTGMCNTHP